MQESNEENLSICWNVREYQITKIKFSENI